MSITFCLDRIAGYLSIQMYINKVYLICMLVVIYIIIHSHRLYKQTCYAIKLHLCLSVEMFTFWKTLVSVHDILGINTTRDFLYHCPGKEDKCTAIPYPSVT